MAAIIDLHTGSSISKPSVVGSSDADAFTPLRLIQGGKSPAVLQMRRIYFFRRCVAGLIATAVLLAVAMVVLGAVRGLGSDSVQVGEGTSTYVVEKGDTLWSLARTIDPEGDARDVIDRIAQINSTSDATFDVNAPLRPGQELSVPLTN